MLLKNTLEQVIAAQKETISIDKMGFPRTAIPLLPDLSSHVLIVSGIRRCGKSTLLFQLLKEKYPAALYVNFEDPRLYGFAQDDFARLDEVIKTGDYKVLLFDEIQVISQWEKYVRQKLDEGFKIIVTGSNASLLSRELGTKLTGRHITVELFPFSYFEFRTFLKLNANEQSVVKYQNTGGFPEYIKYERDEILHHLFEDILIKDIAVRYGVRDIKSLQQLALYLISNVAKPVSANRLKGLVNIAATSTVLEYLSHMEFAYLFQFVPRFSFSLRKQSVNPKKIYAIDTGMINVNSNSFTEDSGRKFENLVYLELRRSYSEIYYFSEQGECDFVVMRKGKISHIIQACYELNQDNLDRELKGLVEALNFFKLKNGSIITLNQTDHIEIDGNSIEVIPFYNWSL